MNSSTPKMTVQKLTENDMETLMHWRMTVLREVFSIPDGADTADLERENRAYYRTQLPTGGHTAVLARFGQDEAAGTDGTGPDSQAGGEAIGCGGICYYREMPSPDNPNGLCAYLMNIYTAPAYRHRGVAQEIVRFLIEEAQGRGVTKIYLETSEDGRKLYQSLGFKPMKDYLKL